MGQLFIAYNGPMPTTAPIAKVATGITTKTLLQVATPATKAIKVKRWGISFDGSAAATPVQCELIQTDVAATVTAHVAAGVMPYDNAGGDASLMTLGTAATGYTASAEGTVTATRLGDYQNVAPTNQYLYDWVLGNEFHVPISKFLRVRVTTGTTVNATCFIVWEE
jgi:hypothetical protein